MQLIRTLPSTPGSPIGPKFQLYAINMINKIGPGGPGKPKKGAFEKSSLKLKTNKINSKMYVQCVCMSER